MIIRVHDYTLVTPLLGLCLLRYVWLVHLFVDDYLSFPPSAKAGTWRHPAKRLLPLEEFHHRAALPTLARQWNVPFLSKVRGSVDA